MLNSEKLQISLRLPAQLVSSFDRIAESLDRDRTWVMLRALTQYLDQEGADILDAKEGFAELDRGESSDLDAVIDKAKAMIDAVETRRRLRHG